MRVGSGQWLIVPRLKGRHQFSADAEVLSLNFKAHWPNGEPLFRNDRAEVFEVSAYPRLRAASEALLQEVRQRMPFEDRPRTRLLTESCGLEDYLRVESAHLRWVRAYVDTMVRRGVPRSVFGPMDERIAEAVDRLDNQPLNQPFEEHALASAVALSRAQFDRLFVGQLGMTAKAYFNGRRLQRARELLSDTTTPVKQIAYQLGFADPAYFSKWFYQHSGDTPTRFRSGQSAAWRLV